jgi:hypothetical protein
MRMIFLFATAPILAAAQPHLGFLDGNKLYEICSKWRYPCEYYVAGVVDQAVLSDDSNICLPPGARTEQTRDVVRNYLKAHPETRQMSAAYLTYIAVAEKYPCSPH